MNRRNLLSTIASVSLLAGTAAANTFTGSTSPYYLDNSNTSTIYIVQGTSVTSFAEAYGKGGYEGTLAVSNTVDTHPLSTSASRNGGQYTLSGTPTGVEESYPTPAGVSFEQSFDGTSDGVHNYYVQLYGQARNGNFTEDVYQTIAVQDRPIARGA